MRLLADENVPASVVRILGNEGHDIRWIRTEAPGIPDIEVLQSAQREERIILTFERILANLSLRTPGILHRELFSSGCPGWIHLRWPDISGMSSDHARIGWGTFLLLKKTGSG